MPKVPFFLGGAYSMENLWAGDAVEGMRFKADLAMQTTNLPDGTQIRIVSCRKTDKLAITANQCESQYPTSVDKSANS